MDRRGADPLRGARRGGAPDPGGGDVWLDAGIVPFSTLGWRNESWIPGGYATGASRALGGRPA